MPHNAYALEAAAGAAATAATAAATGPPTRPGTYKYLLVPGCEPKGPIKSGHSVCPSLHTAYCPEIWDLLSFLYLICFFVKMDIHIRNMKKKIFSRCSFFREVTAHRICAIGVKTAFSLYFQKSLKLPFFWAKINQMS
jgi:hypothetical protein